MLLSRYKAPRSPKDAMAGLHICVNISGGMGQRAGCCLAQDCSAWAPQGRDIASQAPSETGGVH